MYFFVGFHLKLRRNSYITKQFIAIYIKKAIPTTVLSRDTVLNFALLHHVSILLSGHKFDFFFIFKGYKLENILQLLTGLQFDIYVIKTRVGIEIAELPKFLNNTSSCSFTLKNSESENFRKLSGVYL